MVLVWTQQIEVHRWALADALHVNGGGVIVLSG